MVRIMTLILCCSSPTGGKKCLEHKPVGFLICSPAVQNCTLVLINGICMNISTGMSSYFRCNDVKMVSNLFTNVSASTF